MGNDRELQDRLRALKGSLDVAPSEELYQRIVTVAPLLRQETLAPRRNPLGVTPLSLGLTSLLRFFGEWNYALEFKCASLAVMALAGFFAGHSEWQALGHESFFSAIITGNISWED